MNHSYIYKQVKTNEKTGFKGKSKEAEEDTKT